MDNMDPTYKAQQISVEESQQLVLAHQLTSSYPTDQQLIFI